MFLMFHLPLAVLHPVHDKPQKIYDEKLQEDRRPRHGPLLVVVSRRQQVKMPDRRQVSDQHDVALGIRQVLLDLSEPVESRQWSGEVDGLGVSTAAPYCVPDKDDEVRHTDPLVAKEQSGVVVKEERSFGGRGGYIGHCAAGNTSWREW
jgi:hypothetical protein